MDNQDFDYIDHSEATAEIEQKLPLDDKAFEDALEQLNSGAIDKEYILNGYALTDAQRIAVEAQ